MTWCWLFKLGYSIALELTSIFAVVTLQNEHHIPDFHKHRWNSSGSHNSNSFPPLLILNDKCNNNEIRRRHNL